MAKLGYNPLSPGMRALLASAEAFRSPLYHCAPAVADDAPRPVSRELMELAPAVGDKPTVEAATPSPVVRGDDQSAYRPAQEVLDLMPDRIDGIKALHRLLRSAPWIRRGRPTPRRLLVHVGDLIRALALVRKYGADPDDMTGATFESWRSQVEARKAQAARKKRPGG